VADASPEKILPEKILIVGGVAGGASCAARARRLSETASIQVFDRGHHVSFANCGLPYFVGDVIQKEEDLLVATPQLFTERFAIDIHLRTEVTAIDRQARRVTVRDLDAGSERHEEYDALVLATGAGAVRPPIPGLDRAGVFAVRSIPDSRNLRAWIADHGARRAVVIGGGFIGLEMTENLVHRGLAVSLVEKSSQVMPALDAEMATPVHCRLREEGVDLRLNEGVAAVEEGGPQADGAPLLVRTDAGAALPADLVILAIGVRPETALARAAGVDLGDLGGVRVDAQMRTSDPSIWAVGDVVEVQHVVTGKPMLLPLAGPANRQGRIAADSMFGRPSRFRGVQGTSVCGLFGMTLAVTGAGERQLRAADMAYEKIYLHPGHHVGYYPGSKPIDLKLLYAPDDGRLLGAQAVGWEGVDKRVDVIAMAIQGGMSVFDLEECELCYAPQFGAAKDPVNLAGMIGANALRGDAPVVSWEAERGGAVLLDVRDRDEFDEDHPAGAVNLPLHELRSRLDELPRDRPLHVYCLVGQRAYYATRLLRLHGFDARNLTGGYKTWRQVEELCGD
jgi:NADPH-dependent 2,4-dienoyl-CoA reductase/sulfur reductase-like enzyme/rhodanese-related sulfurtransferase